MDIWIMFVYSMRHFVGICIVNLYSALKKWFLILGIIYYFIKILLALESNITNPSKYTNRKSSNLK